jgi:hypothetical protein
VADRQLRRGRAAVRRLPLAVLAAALSSCAADRAAPPAAQLSLPLPLGEAVRAARILDAPGRLECVPYARRLSGIRIRGDAWTWWDSARGRYGRGRVPAPGSVLVFRRYRGSLGHVAVVRRVIGARLIVADHADWLNGGRIHKGTPIADLSAAGDWSEVRVWYTPGGHWGRRLYPAYGFIYPGRTVADSRGP